MSFDGGMGKQTVVHPYHEILLRIAKEQAIDKMQQRGWISRELCWVLKANLKRLLYDSIYKTFLKWQN